MRRRGERVFKEIFHGEETMTDSVNSENGTIVRLELLSFFHANPHTADTLEGLASRLGRSQKLVKVAVGKLVELGILGRHGNGVMACYRLIRPGS